MDTLNASTVRTQVTLTQVEVAIARCLNAHPVIDYTLPRESSTLTELLALMIFHRVAVVEASRLDEKTRAALGQWGVAQ
jgi:hypothetical protein